MKADAFRDQVAVITGASSGIGKALALQLAGQRSMVVIAARRAEQLEDVAEECRARGGEVSVVPTDVSDEAQYKVRPQRRDEQLGTQQHIRHSQIIREIDGFWKLKKSSMKRLEVKIGLDEIMPGARFTSVGT